LISSFKHAIEAANVQFTEQFTQGTDVVTLVHARAQFIDGLLIQIWQQQMPEDAAASLIAVGGYGRGELHPGSDIDVLILTVDDPQNLAPPLEAIIMLLWDIGLEVGHSVRSLQQCIEEATHDVTVMTNLMESRYLAGQASLYTQLQERIQTQHIWPSDAFFSAKLAEQQTRHNKTGDTGHNLEPNIKTSPGGLRDIQMIGWVAKRHFGANRLSDLKRHHFLTENEYQNLKQGEHFLWQVRYALHLHTGRHEDRLLFEHQRTLARQFGYLDENTNLAVEQFMQRYYRTILKLQRLNEMLLQLFQEAILANNQLGEPRNINRRFQARGGYIEVINPATFARYPLAMLEMFLLLQQDPELKGVRANTIRSIRAHRHLIDKHLRQDIRARSLFMEILRQPQGITHELKRMHRYGVLSRYIPAFHHITGLMQFDLFHVYTVDEHILNVVRNLRRASLQQHQTEWPLCYKIWQHIAKPELLYLAGLFHDIAKGRGGNHSILGAEDAQNFCREHALSEFDTQLVSWLVEQHLLMSTTAQRKDIDDPEVIYHFAAEVTSQQNLDYLYLLTVADMRGTNPARWNSWKRALLGRLYERTSNALAEGLRISPDEDRLIQQTQKLARKNLQQANFTDEAINLCWMEFSAEYFLQTHPDIIAWHTEKLLTHPSQQTQVFMRPDPGRGCSEIFMFGPERDGLFAETTAILDQLSINILGARIDSSSQQTSINSYFVLENDGSDISPERAQEITGRLQQDLNDNKHTLPNAMRRMPRQLKSFVRETNVQIQQDTNRMVTILNLTTYDRPGLLCLIGTVFAKHKLRIHSARVVTEGAIACDSFYLTDRNDEPVTDEQALNALKQALQKALD
jgi:[protein-PII] uridylyltransferase